MLNPKEALDIVLATVETLETEATPLEQALGLVLAEDIISRDDIPPFDNSAMDGYAVRWEDVAEAAADHPVTLDVIDDIKAGDTPLKEIMPGAAARIMTGAQMPVGADTVVRVEDTTTDDGGAREAFETDESDGSSFKPVTITVKVKSKGNVRRAGEDVATGEKVIDAGRELKPAEIGLLASLGFPEVQTVRRARIAIVTTGDELLEVGQPLEPGKIRNSNAYSLAAQITEAGAIPIRLGIASDTKEAARKLFTEALDQADIVLTTGGVSVGKYDVVKDVLDEMGAEQKFWKIAQKPGHPLGFWVLNGRYVFGLPGNPVATMVCFEEYVRPAIRKMMGRTYLFRPEVQAILTSDIRKRPGRLHYIRVRVQKKNGDYYAESTGPQGSGILKSMVLADGLALIPPEIESVKAGERVRTRLISQPEDH
ncbi:MAG: gephyrin-like molybdotransferase Glp [Actinomycetota bacterium]